jgi:hypothetical protein
MLSSCIARANCSEGLRTGTSAFMLTASKSCCGSRFGRASILVRSRKSWEHFAHIFRTGKGAANQSSSFCVRYRRHQSNTTPGKRHICDEPTRPAWFRFWGHSRPMAADRPLRSLDPKRSFRTLSRLCNLVTAAANKLDEAELLAEGGSNVLPPIELFREAVSMGQ